jgi:hemerythrin
MIDEKRVIKKLQSRIDDFVLKHPDKKDCEAVQTAKKRMDSMQ